METLPAKDDAQEGMPAGLFGSVVQNSRAADRDEEQSIPLWLITFGDIMALMLTFFVMMYTMSTPDAEKWDHVSSSMNEGLSKFYGAGQGAGTQDTISIEKISYAKALDLNYLKTLLQDVLDKDARLKGAVLILQKDRLILSLPEDLLFEAGKADVQAGGQQALYAIADVLSRLRNRVEVIGGTEPRPLEGRPGGFASNWELSLARAVNVASGLEAAGYERSITSRGISSGRYAELSAALTEDQRRLYARRVDIVIMTDGGSFRRPITLGQ